MAHSDPLKPIKLEVRTCDQLIHYRKKYSIYFKLIFFPTLLLKQCSGLRSPRKHQKFTPS